MNRPRLPIFPFSWRGKKIDHSKQQSKIMEEKDIITDNETINTSFNFNADESAGGSTHLNEPVEEENQFEKLQDEIQEQKDKYLRLMAEFDNFRRRTAKERLELMKTASKDVIVSLLDVFLP